MTNRQKMIEDARKISESAQKLRYTHGHWEEPDPIEVLFKMVSDLSLIIVDILEEQ